MEFAEFQSVLYMALEENSLSELKDKTKAEKLYKYYNILIEENEKYNLTRITEPHDAIYKHFVDSLYISKHIPVNSKVIDIGCGGGFPSLPLAISRPDLKITSLDSTAKKIAFINIVNNELKLDNISTLTGRAEEIAHNEIYRGKFDIAVARAVASYPVLLEICTPFVKPNGFFIAMKGKYSEDEFVIGKSVYEKLLCEEISCDSYDLLIHEQKEERTLIKVGKIGKTPDKYPRKYGMILKTRL